MLCMCELTFFHLLPFVVIALQHSTIESNPPNWEVYSYIPYDHIDFNVTTFTDDISVTKLGGFSKYPPIRLLTPDLNPLSEPGSTVTAAGWGATVSIHVNSVALIQCDNGLQSMPWPLL